jgi:hypothetical protein
MPTFLFRPLAQDAAPCLDSIGNLAAQFGTSLTATGIKFVDLNRHECVLVLSTDRKVTWSKQKGNRSGLRIDKGMVLHRDSLAQHITEPKGTSGPTSVAPEVWITHNWYERQIEMTEESWTLDGYNAVLTLLVIADADEPEEEDMVGHYEKRIEGS